MQLELISTTSHQIRHGVLLAVYIGRRPCRIRLRGLPIYTAKRTPCRNVVWLFWDMYVNWHTILCHLSDILMPIDIQFNTNLLPMECHLTANLMPIDCQSYATWVNQFNVSLSLTRCSFGCVYWKKAVSNSTQRSSYIHSQKNPVSKCCLIVLGYVCQLTSNLMPLE